MKIRLIVSLCLLFSILFSQEVKYHKVRIFTPSDMEIQTVLQLGVDLEGGKIKRGAFLDAILSDNQIERLRLTGLNFEVLQQDLQQYYARRLKAFKRTGFGYGSMGGYYTYTEMSAQLDSIHLLAPEITTSKFSIGTSHEGRTIWGIKVSDNPDADEGEPELLLTGMHHAREPVSMMQLLYFLYEIAENYGTDEQITHLVNNREIYIVPIVNPDGYVYNQNIAPQGGGMHRKNRNPNGCSGTGVGTDLNRNYGFMWGYDNSGSSPYECDDTFRGDSAFSELETQALRDFVLQHDFKLANNYHTYSDLILYPFGYDPEIYPPLQDSILYRELGEELAEITGYAPGTAPELLYATNGDANDWMYGAMGIYSITMEIGNDNDGFWPPATRIFPLCEEVYPANLFLAQFCGEFPELYSFELDWEGGYPDPGESTVLIPSIRNKGLSDLNEPITLSFSSDNPDVLVSDTVITLSGIASREILELSGGIPVNIGSQALPGKKATIYTEFTFQDGYTIEDSLSFIIGTPDTIFFDNAEAGTYDWNTGIGWGISNEGYESEHSFTDSPSGNYQDNTENVFTYQGSFNLSEISNAVLTFYTRWEIEAGWDFATVEISPDNGNHWYPLQGKYTKQGNGQGVQPEGVPGYDGFMQNWVQEEMNLSDWIGFTQVKLRFALRSDTYVNEDGWYLDDIALLAYPLVFFNTGDVNGDGNINVLDIINVVNIILGNYDPPPEIFNAADMNSDGEINILDVVAIVNLILTQP